MDDQQTVKTLFFLDFKETALHHPIALFVFMLPCEHVNQFKVYHFR